MCHTRPDHERCRGVDKSNIKCTVVALVSDDTDVVIARFVSPNVVCIVEQVLYPSYHAVPVGKHVNGAAVKCNETSDAALSLKACKPPPKVAVTPTLLQNRASPSPPSRCSP